MTETLIVPRHPALIEYLIDEGLTTRNGGRR